MQLALSIPFVMLGGAVGALARYGSQRLAGRWSFIPGWVAILIVNVLGSFLIGFGFAMLTDDITDLNQLRGLTASDRSLDELGLNELLAIFAVGFCGAYTTFSTFSLDNVFLARNRWGSLLINIVGTTILAFGAVALGWYIGGLVAT